METKTTSGEETNVTTPVETTTEGTTTTTRDTTDEDILMCLISTILNKEDKPRKVGPHLSEITKRFQHLRELVKTSDLGAHHPTREMRDTCHRMVSTLVRVINTSLDEIECVLPPTPPTPPTTPTTTPTSSSTTPTT